MRKNILITTVISVFLILAVPASVLHGHEIIELEDITFYDLSRPAQKEVECLADNMYFESGNEPKEGKIAVGLVTLNRVKMGFDNSICGVVKQRTSNSEGLIICQFSWWCDTRAKSKSLHKEKYLSAKEKELYNEIKQLAVYVYLNHETMKDKTQGALFFHANYINPQWKLRKTAVIGNHVFYAR
jgi:spore germination cell wall hydrolase CwlJ-like protein